MNLRVILYVDGKHLPRNNSVHQQYKDTPQSIIYYPTTISLYEKKTLGSKLFNHRLQKDLCTKRSKALKTSLQRLLLDRPYHNLEDFLHRMTWTGIIQWILTPHNLYFIYVILFVILLRTNKDDSHYDYIFKKVREQS